MINLETIPLKEVPVGGCFIYKGLVGFYAAVRRSVGEEMSASDLIYSAETGTPVISTIAVDNNREVAYTGMILPTPPSILTGLK